MNLTRRRLFVGAATVTIAGMAGCSSSSDSGENGTGTAGEGTVQRTDPENIVFPEHHGENGVTDVESAFGRDSRLLNTTSVDITLDITQTQQDNPGTERDESSAASLTVTVKTNQDQQRSHLVQEFENRTIEQYLGDGVLYVKQGSGDSVQYRASEKEYVGQTEYIVQVLQNLRGVTFAEVAQTGDVLTYALSSAEGIDGENPLQSDSEGRLSEVDFEYVVSVDGLPQTFDTTYTLESQGVKIDQVIEYSNYDNVSVSEPDWLAEAKEQTDPSSSQSTTEQQPSVTGEVEWADTENGVEVTLDSLSRGDSALVFVGNSQFTTVSVGETVTVPKDAYTESDSGTVSPIAVAAQTEGGEYVVIGQHTPSE